MKRFLLLLIFVTMFAAVVSAFAQTTQVPEQGKNRQRGGKHFQQLDKNNDGQISREEWTRNPKAFDRLDLNHDGMITKAELQEARQKRQPK